MLDHRPGGVHRLLRADGAARDGQRPADVRGAREPVLPSADGRRVQARVRQALPPPAARQGRARAGVRGARPLRRHAADDAQHLALPANGLGDADPLVAARRRRANRLVSRPGSSCPACARARSATRRSTGSGSCTASSSVTAAGTSRRSGPASISITSSSTASGSRATATSSTRSTSRRASTSIRATRAPASFVPGQPQAAPSGDRGRGVHRRLRRRLARGGRRSREGRLVAAAVDRPRGARVARGRRAATPATSPSARARKAAARRTSASAAGRSAGCTSRPERSSGA